jgi:glycosyltransferase involved in cell wall biosynthesis
MIAAMESARAAGSNIEPLNFWSREADFDLIHLWGLDLQHNQTVRWARCGGKKTVMSVLVEYSGWKSRLRNLASSAVGPARLRRAMLAAVDCLTAVNEAQARCVVATFGVPAKKVKVVPNLVEDVFFEARGGQKAGPFGIENYALCTGNVCRRKNQLSLVAACRKLGVPVLLVGSILTGEEDYGRAVAEAMSVDDGSRWIKELSPGSVELVEAYRGAAVFALPSFGEQQPISALEAAACGKPIVLADRPYAKQEFYESAVLADPCSVDSIAGALREAFNQPEAHCPPLFVIEQCRREKVGAAYMAIYQCLVSDAR